MPPRPAKSPAKSPAKPVKKAVARVKQAPKVMRKVAKKTAKKTTKKTVKPAAAVKLAAPPPALRLAAANKPAPVPAIVAAPEEPMRAHLPQPGESRGDWFARVARNYYRFLYATALSITRNNDDAEDAVQNGVMNGLKRLDQLTEDGAIISWLAMITRNAALDLLRRRKRTPGGGGDATILPLSAPEQGNHEYQLHDDLREVLAHAITTLPPSYQEVINARHFRGLEVEDIAKDLGTTENNIRVRLFRAYEKLRESAQIRRAMGLPADKPD